MKKKLNTLISMTSLVLPTAWVINCFDGGWILWRSGKYLAFVGSLIAACLFSFLFIGIGSGFSGMEISEPDEIREKKPAWYLLVEIAILFAITYAIDYRK